MKGLIPENILEDILSRVDIVEVISGYFPLKRAGRNFKANCPFHQEKTPSFMVSAERQIYHCFGCGESGNAFKFLMRYERMEFPEAVETLAKKTGVQLPRESSHDSSIASLSTQLYKVNELAALFFQQNLKALSAKAGMDYLHKRQISDQTIAECKLGFAQDKWDCLITHLRQKNVPLALLEKAGLIMPKDNGGYYDRFRNRIVFPIIDVKDRIIGFGARVLDNSLPKYINSPETPVYTKGKNLFGLNFAKDQIRQDDFVVIVEGNLDFMIPYQQGLKNIVASLGTALTPEQARLLKRYTHNVVMVYDADLAGQLATLRSLDIFIDEGLEVKVVSLPEGFDPDSFVREKGIDAFKEKIASAEYLFDYKLKILKSRYNIKEIQGKARVSSEMLATIGKFTHEVIKSEYLKRLADELNVKEEALWQELRKIKPAASEMHRPSEPLNGPQVSNPTEKLLMKLMMEEKEIIFRIKEHLAPGDFQDARISRIVKLLFSFIEEGKNIEPSSLINYFDDDDSIGQLVCEAALPQETSEENRQKVVDDCIQRIKSKRIKIQRDYLQEEIRLAQHAGDEDKINNLMRQFHDLLKKR